MKQHILTTCALLEVFSIVLDLSGFTTTAKCLGLLGAILACVGAVIYSTKIIKAQIYDHKMGY